MIRTPYLWWPTAILAVSLFSDAVLSVKPAAFIEDCLNGVRFPRDWWWALIVIKLLATAGLLAGYRWVGVGITVNAAVIAYFLCAAYGHYRAGFMKQAFWLNCLGMLALSTAVLLFSYVIKA